MNSAYEIITASLASSSFLGSIRELFDDSEISFYVPESTTKITRKVFDGFITLIGTIEGQKVGLVYNDFRSFGSSAGESNSHRVCSFIEYLEGLSIPLIYLSNSMGVRVQDGRNVFKNSFSIIPKIKSFTQKNLYITASLGHTLGLSAVLYSLGHYRYALDGKCKFNLTGPEVFKLFFGNNLSFEKACNEKVLQEETLLVQEIVTDQNQLFLSIKKLINKNQKIIELQEDENLSEQMNFIDENSLEVFSQFGKSIKTKIINTKSGRKGLIINPYNKPNMITVKDIDKYMMALDLFEKLKLPIFSLVDTAGGDPRVEENNQNIARKLYDLSCKIIDYPYRKQGIIIGRCFGGSSILSMPVFFGGEKSLLVKGAQIGIMSDKIIKQLLAATPQMLKTWEENKERETEDYKDLIEDGVLERVILPSELVKYITNEY